MMSYQGIHLVLFLFILIFNVGNIVTYMHQPLISLTPAKVTEANKLFYTSYELKFIRSQCYQDQKLRLIDVEVLNRIRSLKIAKRRKGEEEEVLLGTQWLPSTKQHYHSVDFSNS